MASNVRARTEHRQGSLALFCGPEVYMGIQYRACASEQVFALRVMY